jgi:hypothetical protein
MIAVRIGPDTRFAVVGTKSYFAKRRPPQTPQDMGFGEAVPPTSLRCRRITFKKPL